VIVWHDAMLCTRVGCIEMHIFYVCMIVNTFRFALLSLSLSVCDLEYYRMENRSDIAAADEASSVMQ